jgi:hypothetical protein
MNGNSQTASPTLDHALRGVDTARLMAHIREFSLRVKLSGTKDEYESFCYLEAQMQANGFQTRLIRHDAYISLPGASHVSVDGVAIRSITHSMSRPTGSTPLEAPLVHVGGGNEEDFSDVDVRGKIVLVDGIALEDVAERASRKGAIAQIHVSPTEHLYEMCISPVWGSPSQLTLGELPSTAAATVPATEGAMVRSRCLAGESVTARLQTEVDTGWRKIPLLVCDLDSTDASADTPFVLFSGHHDSWHFGVMDNGSANATMLECARILAANRSAWRRKLRVCFWSGHSHGRYAGSAWYADEYWSELAARCAAHVNIDSTGGREATVLTNSGVIDELRSLAREVVQAESGQIHNGHRHGRVADHSFWGVGIPSMFGSLSHQAPAPGKPALHLGWWWHTPHDLADKIDPANLTRDTRIVFRALWRLLTDRILPFDYSVFANSLLREFRTVEAALADAFDLTPLYDAAIRLNAAALAFRAASEAAEGPRCQEMDVALMRVSRALVPINYTSGDRFQPDPALTLPPWPALQGLRDLALAVRDPARAPFFQVQARRTRNRILHALNEATMHFNAAMSH